jgi:hypothetical protein
MQRCVIRGGKPVCECRLVACIALYLPVCGSDGKTYSNNCTLAAAGCRKSQNIRVVSRRPCPERLSKYIFGRKRLYRRAQCDVNHCYKMPTRYRLVGKTRQLATFIVDLGLQISITNNFSTQRRAQVENL